jgi:hypothetical protein
MALQERPPSGRSPPRSGGLKSPSTIPSCPQCQRRMIVKRVAPVLFATNLDDVIYGCEKCHTEVRRTKRT